MTLLSVILSFAILLAGCYTNTPLTKDSTLNIDNEEVTFYLTDGTSIKSKREEHHRVANGYKIVGKLNSNQLWNTTSDFDGIVRDEQIKDITVSELNSDSIVVGGAVLVLGCIVALVIWSDFEVSFRGSTP